MTREDAIAQLNAISDKQEERRKREHGYADFEEGHRDADNILLSLLNDAEVTTAYCLVGKWYS